MMVFLIIIFFLFSTSKAKEVEDLIDYALKNSPRLKIYEDLKRSLKYRSDYFKSLPNPNLLVGLNNLPLNRPYPSKYEGMSSLSFGISQMYTLPIKREREAFVMMSEVEVVEAQRRVAEKELIRDIKVKYLEWLYTFKREDLLKGIIEEIKRLEKITEENYKLGRGNLSEILSLKAEAIRVEGEIERILEERRLIKEEIDSLLGYSFDLKGEDFEIKEKNLGDIRLEETVYIVPLLKEREKIRAEVERLRVEHLPDVELMAEYMIRPELENMINLRASISLPIRKSKREDLLVLEKLQELKAKDWEIENLKLNLKKEINSLRVQKERAESLRAITEKLLEEKVRELKSLEFYYPYGKADFRDLLRLYRELWEIRMKLLDLDLEIKSLLIKGEVYL